MTNERETLTKPRTARTNGVSRFVAALALASVLVACDDGGTSSGAGSEANTAQTAANTAPVVRLDPGAARLSGSAQYKCWDDGCWWVVWCGHAICDGAWQWRFPASGQYSLTWNGLSYKCAGAPPYSVAVNGKVIVTGRVPRHGDCSDCDAGRWGTNGNLPLGSFSLDAGDTVTLWAQTDFACGINGPGAYAAYDDVTATRR